MCHKLSHASHMKFQCATFISVQYSQCPQCWQWDKLLDCRLVSSETCLKKWKNSQYVPPKYGQWIRAWNKDFRSRHNSDLILQIAAPSLFLNTFFDRPRHIEQVYGCKFALLHLLFQGLTVMSYESNTFSKFVSFVLNWFHKCKANLSNHLQNADTNRKILL